MLNICSAKFDFISGCVNTSICSVYHVLKDHLFDQFRTVITFKFVYTCGCVFFMFVVVCGFVCEVSFEGVVCIVYYVVFQFLKVFAIFYVDLL